MGSRLKSAGLCARSPLLNQRRGSAYSMSEGGYIEAGRYSQPVSAGAAAAVAAVAHAEFFGSCWSRRESSKARRCYAIKNIFVRK